MVLMYVFFFFFQAEDGIRDLTVTGVQTCALPICLISLLIRASSQRPLIDWALSLGLALYLGGLMQFYLRSEERRVGKGVDLGGRRSMKKKNMIVKRWMYVIL